MGGLSEHSRTSTCQGFLLDVASDSYHSFSVSWLLSFAVFVENFREPVAFLFGHMIWLSTHTRMDIKGGDIRRTNCL